MAEQERKLTLGEYRVGVKFNPSNNPLVDEIKAKAAALIDLVEPLKANDVGDGEIKRLVALAQTDVEIAAMNAVKACTKEPFNK